MNDQAAKRGWDKWYAGRHGVAGQTIYTSVDPRTTNAFYTTYTDASVDLRTLNVFYIKTTQRRWQLLKSDTGPTALAFHFGDLIEYDAFGLLDYISVTPLNVRAW